MRPGTATESSGAPPTPPSGEHGGDRYAVRKQIAAGGMGVVYHVYDRITGEERAQKRIRRRGNEPLRDVEAFEREYQVLAGLDHPRIIRVYDYGVDAVGPYYTMELLEGEDMRHAAPLPPESCPPGVETGAQAGDAGRLPMPARAPAHPLASSLPSRTTPNRSGVSAASPSAPAMANSGT